MLPDRIILVDRSSALVQAWEEAFEDVEGVSVHEGTSSRTPRTRW